MVTEREVAQEEELKPQEEEQSSTPETPEVDPRAELDQLKNQLVTKTAEVTKLTGDLNSLRGTVGQRLDLEKRLSSIQEDLSMMGKNFNLLATGVASGETEGLPGQLQTNEREREKQKLQEQSDSYVNGLLGDMKEEADEAGLDLQTASQFAEAQRIWGQGLTQGNMRMLDEARRMVTRVARQYRNGSTPARSETQTRSEKPQMPGPRASAPAAPRNLEARMDAVLRGEITGDEAGKIRDDFEKATLGI